MPHIKLRSRLDLAAARSAISKEVRRHGLWVMRVESTWTREDQRALLVEGTVVEGSRPLRPVVYIGAHESSETTIVRIWSRAPIKATRAVQRWLVELALDLQAEGVVGEVVETDLAAGVLEGLELESAEEPAAGRSRR